MEERDLSIEEVFEANEKGTLEEVFGSGTAAVISPVGVLAFKDKVIQINNNEIGQFTSMMYDKLTSIQLGTEEDIFGWVKKID